jgi:hypothetical protein
MNPEYRMMETVADARASVAQVLSAATRELRVFDVKPGTLRDREFGVAANVELIRALLLADREHRLYIVLHDTKGIEGDLPRVIALLRQFSAQISIHRTVGAAREAQDTMIIADDHTIWRKPVANHPRSVFECGDLLAIKPYFDRYHEIWEASEHAVSDGALGL